MSKLGSMGYNLLTNGKYWWKTSGDHQLKHSLTHYLQSFNDPRWCRISSINSAVDKVKYWFFVHAVFRIHYSGTEPASLFQSTQTIVKWWLNQPICKTHAQIKFKIIPSWGQKTCIERICEITWSATPPVGSKGLYLGIPVAWHPGRKFVHPHREQQKIMGNLRVPHQCPHPWNKALLRDD